jgi:hypothetical protein
MLSGTLKFLLLLYADYVPCMFDGLEGGALPKTLSSTRATHNRLVSLPNPAVAAGVSGRGF